MCLNMATDVELDDRVSGSKAKPSLKVKGLNG